MFQNKDEFIKQNTNKKNPFAEKCENCTTNMWEYLKQKENDNLKCSSKTYVRIEKFKDDD